MLTFAHRKKPNRPAGLANPPTTVRVHIKDNPAVDSILNLQRTIGNYAVDRLLGSATSAPIPSIQLKCSQKQADHSTPLRIARDAEQYWFQDKPPVKATVSKDGIPVVPKGQVALDPRTQQVSLQELGVSFTVQFAGMDSDFVGGKANAAMSQGENLVLEAIKNVVADLGSLPERHVTWEGGSTKAEAENHKKEAFREAKAQELRDRTNRARLKEVFHALNNRTLNIFIATDLTITEKLAPGRPSLKTQQIFVHPDDINDRKKLEAAIRIPLVDLVGGEIGVRSDGKGGLQATTAQPFTESESKEAVLHELVHVLLINRGASANQLWEGVGLNLVSGPAEAKQLCESLLRRYFRAQEEVFVYKEVGKVSSEFMQNKQVYDVYIQLVETFLTDISAKPDQNKNIKLDVSEKVEKKVDWNISYRFPKSVTTKTENIDTLKTLIVADPAH
jgi:hypothetical protein